MIEQWEVIAAKNRLSRAAQRINDIVYKMSLEDIPSDSPLYKARQEYEEALNEMSLMQSELKKEKKARKKKK